MKPLVMGSFIWNAYKVVMQTLFRHFLQHMEGNMDFWRLFHKVLRHVAYLKFGTNFLKKGG